MGEKLDLDELERLHDACAGLNFEFTTAPRFGGFVKLLVASAPALFDAARGSERLRTDLWLAARDRDRTGTVDHACAQCGGSLVIPGFVCWFHHGKSLPVPAGLAGSDTAPAAAPDPLRRATAEELAEHAKTLTLERFDAALAQGRRDREALEAVPPWQIDPGVRFRADPAPAVTLTTTHGTMDGANTPSMTITCAPPQPGEPASIPSCWPAPGACDHHPDFACDGKCGGDDLPTGPAHDAMRALPAAASAPVTRAQVVDALHLLLISLDNPARAVFAKRAADLLNRVFAESGVRR